jgi:GAF domain-containing protein
MTKCTICGIRPNLVDSNYCILHSGAGALASPLIKPLKVLIHDPNEGEPAAHSSSNLLSTKSPPPPHLINELQPILLSANKARHNKNLSVNFITPAPANHYSNSANNSPRIDTKISNYNNISNTLQVKSHVHGSSLDMNMSPSQLTNPHTTKLVRNNYYTFKPRNQNNSTNNSPAQADAIYYYNTSPPYSSPLKLYKSAAIIRLITIIRNRIIPNLSLRWSGASIVKSFLSHKFGGLELDWTGMINKEFGLDEFRYRVAAKLHHLNSSDSITATVESMVQMFKALKSFNKLLPTASALNAGLSKQETLTNIVQAVESVVESERVTLYLIEKSGIQLALADKAHSSYKHFPVEHARCVQHGIISYVAKAGEIINIADASSHPRFIPDLDKKSGFKTKSILAIPVYSYHKTQHNDDKPKGEVIAIIELVNKKLKPSEDENSFDSKNNPLHSSFTWEDVNLLKFIAVLAGQCLENASLYEQSIRRRTQQEKLSKLIELMSAETEVNIIINQIITAATQLISVDRVNVYIVDESKSKLICKVHKDRSMMGIKLPLNYGLPGLVYHDKKLININNPNTDPRFDSNNLKLDAVSNYKTHNVLTMPIIDNNNKVVAIIQLVNKKEINDKNVHLLRSKTKSSNVSYTAFTLEDESLMNSLVSSAGQILRKAQVFESLLKEQRKIGGLIRILQITDSEENSEAMLLKTLEITHAAIEHSQQIALFFIDNVKDDMFALIVNNNNYINNNNTYSHFTISSLAINSGFAGHVVATGKSLNIACKARESQYYNSSLDLATGLMSESLLCHPIKSRDNTVIAVLQCVNKVHKKLNNKLELLEYSEADEEIAAALSIQLSSTLKLRLSELLLNRSKNSEQMKGINSLLEIYGNTKNKIALFEANQHKANNNHRTSLIYTNNTDNSSALQQINAFNSAWSAVTINKNNLYKATADPIELTLSPWPRELVNNRLVSIDILSSLEFNPFDYDEEELLHFTLIIFNHFNLIQHFELNQEKFHNFLLAIRSKYLHNPYHSFYHGFAVLQFLFFIIKQTQINQQLNSLDLLSLLIGGLVHDVGHPGNNNSFEISIASELATLHNDQSVLENYHAFITFQILRHSSCNIFDSESSKLASEEVRSLRASIITSLLHTDMMQHFELCKSLDKREKFDYSKHKDKQVVLNVLTHAADISGQVLPIELAVQWEQRVTEEFIHQAGVEKSLGIPTALFMQDLTISSVRYKNHVNFLDFVMQPYWLAVSNLFPPLKCCYNNLINNRKYFNDKTILPSSA